MKNNIILFALTATTSIMSMDHYDQTNKIDNSIKIAPSKVKPQNLAKIREILIILAHIKAK